MRGYLQHLVANGAGLEQTVHPLVGSMFQSVAWGEMIETNPTEPSITEGSSRLSKTIPAVDPGSALVQEQSRIGLTKAVVSERIAPSVPQKEDETKTPVVRQGQLHEYRRDEVKSSQLDHPASVSHEHTGGDVTNSPALPKAAPIVLRPRLMTEMPKPDATKEEPRNHQPAAHGAWVYPRTDHRAQRSAFRQDETKPMEDIQIHIGRIEVVAVPPPPVSNSPKPVRKSLSLEDYLKRSSGRRS